MRTAVVYCSRHHGNTKKLLDAIAGQYPAELIDAASAADLSAYDVVGFASGIYYSGFHKSVMEAARRLPKGKDVFLLYTYGAPGGKFTGGMEGILREREARLLGSYGCRGYDTFGPFKLVGGIAKGHPTREEIDGAVRFYEKIVEKR